MLSSKLRWLLVGSILIVVAALLYVKVDSSESQTHQTIGDLWRDLGLSDEDLELAMSFFPLNPNISLDDHDGIMANFEEVAEFFDGFMRKLGSDMTVDEARVMVGFLNSDPSVTEDEYQYITKELFPIDVQIELKKEGVL